MLAGLLPLRRSLDINVSEYTGKSVDKFFFQGVELIDY